MKKKNNGIRKKTVDIISYRAKEDNEQSILSKKIIYKLHNYYKINDIEEGKNSAEVFELLYMSTEQQTYENVSEYCYISESTLYRMVNKFNFLCRELIKELEEFQELKMYL